MSATQNTTLNYNGKSLKIGSIAVDHPMIKDHILAHFNVSEVDKLNDERFQRFHSQTKEMKNFIALTKNKNTLLDIGSQFGSFSFSFIGDSNTKQAYAFDGGMNPYLTTTQMKLINRLDNFHTFNFLIGNKNEIVKCFSEDLQSLALPGNDSRIMFSIDMLVNLFGIEPDVIKIDIEGSEYQALQGAYDTICIHRPILFMEIHPNFLNLYNNNIHDIASFVDLINYDVYDLNQTKVSNYLEELQKEVTDSNRTIWLPKK